MATHSKLRQRRAGSERGAGCASHWKQASGKLTEWPANALPRVPAQASVGDVALVMGVTTRWS